jgi:hypothetical protein
MRLRHLGNARETGDIERLGVDPSIASRVRNIQRFIFFDGL